MRSRTPSERLWRDPRLPERFWSKVLPNPLTECWYWTGFVDRDGYARLMQSTRRSNNAHRLAYEALIGPLPRGTESDHKCRVRYCVNPLHIDPVVHAVNMQRIPPEVWQEARRMAWQERRAKGR